MKVHAQVRLREAALGALRPFDKANCSFIKVFVKTRLKELFRGFKTIKIKVI